MYFLINHSMQKNPKPKLEYIFSFLGLIGTIKRFRRVFYTINQSGHNQINAFVQSKVISNTTKHKISYCLWRDGQKNWLHYSIKTIKVSVHMQYELYTKVCVKLICNQNNMWLRHRHNIFHINLVYFYAVWYHCVQKHDLSHQHIDRLVQERPLKVHC